MTLAQALYLLGALADTVQTQAQQIDALTAEVAQLRAAVASTPTAEEAP